MLTTIDFLEAIKTRHNVTSDYALAKYLGLTRSAISKYRNTKTAFDETMALRVAEALEIDPAYVLACVSFERANCTEAKEAWQRLAQRYMPVEQTLKEEKKTCPEDDEGAFDALCKIDSFRYLYA